MNRKVFERNINGVRTAILTLVFFINFFIQLTLMGKFNINPLLSGFMVVLPILLILFFMLFTQPDYNYSISVGEKYLTIQKWGNKNYKISRKAHIVIESPPEIVLMYNKHILRLPYNAEAVQFLKKFLDYQNEEDVS